MLREQTFEKLNSLKLHGMAQAFEQQLENPDAASLGFEDRLAMLVEAQWLWRENQAIKSRLRHATLKMPATIEDINYRHARQLERSMIRSLSSCDWVRQHHNVLISGPAGIGKTYICCALLDKACRQGFSARYLSAPKFFRRLGIAYADGSFDRMLAKLAKTDVVAIDDWGLAPLTDMQKQHLLEVLDDRCGARSTIVASQFVIDKWHDLVGSPTLADAIMERMLSNSYRIDLKGETLRSVKRGLKPEPQPDAKEDA
jgi:DNA replication protein DnaC